VDEVNALLGAAAPFCCEETVELLQELQGDLFRLGTELAIPGDAEKQPSIPLLVEERVEALELYIDRRQKELPALSSFILPGGEAGGALLHLARSVARRAERELVELAHELDVRPALIKYTNRLSDLLFVLARYENHRAGAAETEWPPNEDSSEKGSSPQEG
jgi:cob(I)alamin adenosyltransferase